MVQSLGKLEKVNIRKIWEHEALSFTPWLAHPDNLSLLGDALGIEFNTENIKTEVGVGDFNADIVTADYSDRSIIIENQLERTDHDHLGKCITYAAGIGAETIIWIASNIRDEHRQAVEWLNFNSSDKINFFWLSLRRIKSATPNQPRTFWLLKVLTNGQRLCAARIIAIAVYPK